MCKYTCLDCQNYCPSTSKVVGYDKFGFPITKEIKAHCADATRKRYFNDWWKHNGHKTKQEIKKEPICLILREHLKRLNGMILLCNDILEKLQGK